MNEEDRIFRKMTADFARLAPFGFQPCPEGFRYVEGIMDGEFRAEVVVGGTGAVSGRVIDAETGEEYLPARQTAQVGAYVGATREAYAKVLRRVARACFQEQPFLFAQANRLARLIAARYGERPDFPFKKLPDYGVFRFPENRRWYALVMQLRRSLFSGGTGGRDEEASLVEVLNLKPGADRMAELLALPGIFPGYHMKRTAWISVLLDETTPDALIMDLVDRSRNFAVQAGRGRRSRDRKDGIA